MSEAAQTDQPMTVSPLREQAIIERGLAMDATTFDGIHSVFSNGTAFQLATKMASMLASSTIMPEAYQNNPSNCLIAIDYAARLNVSPVMLAQNMDVVKGTPGLRGKFLAALINACPLFGRLKYEWRGTDKPGGQPTEDFGCRAYTREVETGEILYGAWIDWRMVVAEGWNTNKKWTSMREQMFTYRSAAFWSRAFASDVTLGLYESDELQDIHGPTVRVVADPSRISDLSARLAARAGQAIEHVPDVKPEAPAETKAEGVDLFGQPIVEVEIDSRKLRASMHLAEDVETLDALASDISLIADADDKAEVNELYLKRREALGGK